MSPTPGKVPALSPLARQLLLSAGTFLLLAIIVLAGYRLSPTSAGYAVINLPADPGCNLHRGPCEAVWGGGRVTLSITPRPIPLISPILIAVETSGLAPLTVHADIVGIGMDMGPNRSALAPTGGGRFVGETTLPVCITNMMAWELALLIDTATGRLRIPFRFSTPETQPS